jgi:hypothetical protein
MKAVGESLPICVYKIITNIVNLETDEDSKRVKKIQKDAVLSIQQGISPEELMWILNSHVSVELDQAYEQYNKINEYVSLELSVLLQEVAVTEDDYIETYRHIAEKIVNGYDKREKSGRAFQ